MIYGYGFSVSLIPPTQVVWCVVAISPDEVVLRSANSFRRGSSERGRDPPPQPQMEHKNT